MSYLLETLGRGLLSELLSAFENQLPGRNDEPEYLRSRCDDSPTSVDLAVRLGVSCLRRMKLTDARRAFENAQELSPSSAQPALGLACVYDELGQLDQALRHLAVAQAHDPDDPAIAFAVGFCCERSGDMEAATASYRRALDLCPQLRNAYERLAAIAVCRGDWDDAAASYEELAELEPGDLNVLLTLADLYLQGGNPQAACRQFQRALLVEPDLEDETLSATDQLAAEGQIEEALETVRQLVDKYPGVAPFHIHLGDLYAKAGEDGLAIEQYKVALETQPELLEATVKLGTQHLRQRRYADAAQTFNRAVELNDRLMMAFVGLGVSQHVAGDRHEALATLDLASSLEPSTTLLFAEAARLHLKSTGQGNEAPAVGFDGGDPDEAQGDDYLNEALRRHRQALLRSPNHADLHYRYGLLLRQVGDYDEAITAFRNAVAINPNYAKALIKLGICLKETGQPDEAIEVFRRALSLDSTYVDVHYQLGLLFAQRSRFDLAVEEFERAMAGDEKNVALRANLALALQNIGMLDRAAATWHAICELTFDDDGLLERRRHILRDLNQS